MVLEAVEFFFVLFQVQSYKNTDPGTPNFLNPVPRTRGNEMRGGCALSLLSVVTWSSLSLPFLAPPARSLVNTRLSSPRSLATRLFSDQLKSTIVGEDVISAELVVKKSHFIAYAAPFKSFKPSALSFISSIRSSHPKCRHACSAYLSSTEERCDDDGEPAGTAGAPILRAIKGEDLTDVCVVVVRYFGGVKLGAGGLIRAYGNCARAALRACEKEVVVPNVVVTVSFPPSATGRVRALLSDLNSVIYNDQTRLKPDRTSMVVSVETERIDLFQNKMNDVTRGEATIIITDSS